MRRKQYNSAADRRWQQRYQRIQERKENVLDIETPREERRRMRATMYRTGQIDIKRIVPNRVAVLCTSVQQVRQLYMAVEKQNPEYTRWRSVSGLEDSFYFCTDAAIGIITEDYPFFEETTIRVEPKQYYMSRGFEVIDFCELLPVKDLGRVQVEPEMMEFLLGI